MTPLSVIVLAGRGGARLAATLESVGWAAERLLWDPTGRLAGAVLPAGVGRVAEAPEKAAAQPWLLLLREGEVTPPGLTAAIEAAISQGRHGAYRVLLELHAFGARLRLRAPSLRIARRGAARIVLGRGLAPSLAVADAVPGELAPALVVSIAGTLAEAVDDLEADGTMLAALLTRDRRVPRVHHLCLPPLVAAARVLAARGRAGARWTRWVIAVLVGYTAMVAWAKRWEQAEAETT